MIGFIAVLTVIWIIGGATIFWVLMIEHAFDDMPIYKKVIAYMFGGPVVWVMSPFYFMYKWLADNN